MSVQSGINLSIVRWCRALTRPQPPANICQASGLKRRLKRRHFRSFLLYSGKTTLRIACVFAFALTVATVMRGTPAPTTFPRLEYHASLRAGSMDANGKSIFGTEIMHLVPHQGRLYASNSLWMENDPRVPKACQVLVLDSPRGEWKVDLQFTRKNLRMGALKSLTFTTDGSGKAIEPTPILFAAPDTIIGGTIQIFSRDDKAGEWTPMSFGEAAGGHGTTRAMGLHRDRKTGIDRVFAGNNLRGILSGVHDPKAPGRIRWGQKPEFDVPAGERVMGFCDCNGVFYCATTRAILMRDDGPSPTWKQIYSRPEEIPPVGIRGLTSVPNPAGAGEVLLFAALSQLRRVDPSANFKETIELDMRAFLTDAFGIKVPFVLAAYNEILPCVIPGAGGANTKETVWLIGFENTYIRTAFTGKGKSKSGPPSKPRTFVVEAKGAHYAAEARFFIRRADRANPNTIRYEVAEVAAPNATLVAVRAIAVSPFTSDSDSDNNGHANARAFYFAGFDCNSQPSHNTAWIYRGQIPPP